MSTESTTRPGPTLDASIPFPLRFDFVDLRLFVNVAESGSMTHGSRTSALSLGAASTRIKNLESALGTQLLYRTKRGVSLTPAGDTLLHHARHILAQVQRLGGDLQEFAKGVKGHVRIFANTTAVSEFLPPALGSFLADHPFVNVDLSEYPSPDIVRAVQEGKADVGIVAGHVSTAGLVTLPYRDDRLVLGVAKGHALAKRRSVEFVDTLAYDFVGLAPGSAMHSFLERIANERGWALKLRIQVGGYEAMCRMIEAGVGVGVLAESAARRHARTMSIKVVDLEDGWSLQPLNLCVRDFVSLPAFTRQLVDFLLVSAGRPPVA